MSSALSLQNLPISRKIQILVNVVGLAVCVAIGISSYMRATQGMTAQMTEKLIAIADARRSSLQDWIDDIRGDLLVQAGSPAVRDAVKAFGKGWNAMDGNRTETLQKLYIDENPNPVGHKEKLDAAPDGSLYSQVHAYFHPYFRSMLLDRGYYDVFLFDPDGNLLYTVFKEFDYATNLNVGKWKETDLGRVFREARDNPQAGYIAFADFSPYAPSHGAPAGFVATPVLDGGRLAGILAFQLPVGKLDEIMQKADGLGETGESYAVGPDFLMRSNSRFAAARGEETLLKVKKDTPQVRAALAMKDGEDGLMQGRDENGNLVEAAYAAADISGSRWAVVVLQRQEEALSYVGKLRNEIALFTVFSAIVLFFVGIFVGRSLAAPIISMTEAMRRLAGGDTSIGIPGTGRGDEIGEMAGAVQVFRENMMESEALKRRQEEAEKRAEGEKRRAMNDLAGDFERKVGVIVEGVASASVRMQSGAGSLRKIAEQTNGRSVSVASASEQASSNVSTVAAAAEELSASIAEVTHQIHDTVDLASKASAEAERTNATVEGLNAAARRIGDVVTLIRDIAEQTNLLALNPTIEAARAGDAGKGFAVVATEVKNLAGQTARATEDIAAQVAEIQGVSKASVEAIGHIRAAIQAINQRIASVSAAAEQQNATTAEISRNVQQAAQGTQEVTANIQSVSSAAEETMGMAGDVNTAADDLSQKAEQLRQELQSFLGRIRGSA